MFKIAGVIVLVCGYFAGLGEAVHRTWTAASDTEFGTKPINPFRVIALKGLGFLILTAGALFAPFCFAVLLWWVGG